MLKLSILSISSHKQTEQACWRNVTHQSSILLISKTFDNIIRLINTYFEPNPLLFVIELTEVSAVVFRIGVEVILQNKEISASMYVLLVHH